VYKDKVELLTVTNAQLLFEIDQMHKIDIYQINYIDHMEQEQKCLSPLDEVLFESRSKFLE